MIFRRQKASNSSKNNKLAKKIDFEYFAPQAKQVQLAGTFNDWNPSRTELKKDRSGTWRITLLLAPGKYEYRYLVDQSWQNDQRPVECVPNVFGTWNCVVEVR
jgi:1,4-alpha-glucan branching enzyme